MNSSDTEWLFSSSNPEVRTLFDEFAAYRRPPGRLVHKTLTARARFLRDHGTALEDLGVGIAGLPKLEAMLSPNSPARGGAVKEQTDLVDEAIEDAYATVGLRGGSSKPGQASPSRLAGNRDMKLTSFQVGHFRNILDSGEVPTPAKTEVWRSAAVGLLGAATPFSPLRGGDGPGKRESGRPGSNTPYPTAPCRGRAQTSSGRPDTAGSPSCHQWPEQAAARGHQ